MQRPFYRDLATIEQVAFNSAMSEVRLAVEYPYKDLKQFQTSQTFARKLKVQEASIAPLYNS